MTSPNTSGGTDSLAVTGFGPGTAIIAVIGLAMSLAGVVSRRISKSLMRGQ